MIAHFQLASFSQLAEIACAVLFKSMWQFGFIAIAVSTIDRFFCRRNVRAAYALNVGALIIGLAWIGHTGALATPHIAAKALDSSMAPMRSINSNGCPPTMAGESVSLQADRSSLNTNKASVRGLWIGLAPWLFGAYVAGALLMLIRLARSAWKVRQRRRTARRIDSGPIHALISPLCQRLSVSLQPAVAFSESTLVPTILGFGKPMILLPTSIASELSIDQVELVLAHEIVHLKRGDLWVAMLERLSESFLFFNPAIWYLTRRIDTLREHCCDERTCSTQPLQGATGRLQYAETLVRIAEIAGARQLPTAGQIAATGNSPSELRCRIARLLDTPIADSSQAGSSFALALLAAITITITCQFVIPRPAEADERTTVPPASRSFSDGGKVELVALGRDDGDKKIWWDAGGNTIVPNFKWQDGHQMNGRSTGWQRAVIRLRDVPKGSEMTWKIVGATTIGGAGVTIDNNRQPDGYFARHFGTPEGTQNVKIRVGLATGDWQKIVGLEGDYRSQGVASGPPGHGILISRCIDTDEGAFMVVSHNYFETNFRIVAVDQVGKLHDSAGRGGSSANGIYQSQVLFSGLSSDEIARVEFQTRPYDWVEFKELPLAPSKLGLSKK